MNNDCIFCQIAQGAAPASIVYQDEATLAFVDLRQFLLATSWSSPAPTCATCANSTRSRERHS